jgi:outer membrane lipoprotein SlyB
MSANPKPGMRAPSTLVGGGVRMVLCCAIGPALIGAAAGSAISGWLGIACAAILAAVAGLVLHRRTRHHDGC